MSETKVFHRGMEGNNATGASHFGEHLMMDGYMGCPVRLVDPDLVLRCLQELPGKLGMKALSAPQVRFAGGNHLKDPGGWSGYVIIEESHISIHTFPDFRFVSIDVYTCTNGLDTDFIQEYFKEQFRLQELERNFVIRGRQFFRLAWRDRSKMREAQSIAEAGQ